MIDARDNDTSVKTLPAEIPGEVRFLWSWLVTDRLMNNITIILNKRKERKMHLKDFEEHMTLILNGHEILAEDVDMSKKLECIELGRRSYQVCREYFKDEGNNLHRWLIGQPTVVKHPVTGDYMELIIEEGFEALHNLLEFCKLQNSGLTYDTEYFDALLMLIRSNDAHLYQSE